MSDHSKNFARNSLMNLSDLIRDCEKNLSHHIPERSLSGLWQYFQGFLFCKTSVQTGLEDLALLRNFSSWLMTEHKIKFNVSGCRLLLFLSDSEPGALDLFFKSWHIFSRLKKAPPRQRLTFEPQQAPRNTSEMIDHIQLRPGMYLGSLLFKDFYFFLIGYRRGLTDFGIASSDDRFDRFKIWVRTKYRLDRPWFKILELTSNEPSNLLKDFFAQWLSFKAIDQRLIQVAKTPGDYELCFKTALSCCEATRIEGVQLISELITNFHPPPKEEKNLRLKRGLLMESLGDINGARMEILKVQHLHNEKPDEGILEWRTMRSTIATILDRLKSTSKND